MDKYQNAINKLNDLVLPFVGFNPEYHNNIGLLQELVFKAIPEKPIVIITDATKDEVHIVHCCPSCESELVFLSDYCHSCGQRIDRSV